MQYIDYSAIISCQVMNFKEVLNKFRAESFTEREKGTKFERLMRSWLLTDPRYNELEKVWLWEVFPGRKDFGGTDTGIDLVAKTEMGDYWAIQCKCYAEDTTIDKASQIKNDPNGWSREHEQSRYILDLLLLVIILSCQTVSIVNVLPRLDI